MFEEHLANVPIKTRQLWTNYSINEECLFVTLRETCQNVSCKLVYGVFVWFSKVQCVMGSEQHELWANTDRIFISGWILKIQHLCTRVRPFRQVHRTTVSDCKMCVVFLWAKRQFLDPSLWSQRCFYEAEVITWIRRMKRLTFCIRKLHVHWSQLRALFRALCSGCSGLLWRRLSCAESFMRDRLALRHQQNSFWTS